MCKILKWNLMYLFIIMIYQCWTPSVQVLIVHIHVYNVWQTNEVLPQTTGIDKCH